jgi:transcriptional regulator with XRE-family HTH domain
MPAIGKLHGEPVAVSSKTTPPNLDVSMRIKELRKARGWSQRVMAELLGVELTRYQKWEQRGRIAAEFLPQFSRLTNRSIDFILTGAEAVHRSRRSPPEVPR